MERIEVKDSVSFYVRLLIFCSPSLKLEFGPKIDYSMAPTCDKMEDVYPAFSSLVFVWTLKLVAAERNGTYTSNIIYLN